MIVLDTNVISELTRQRPEPRVVAWIASHRGELVTTTITWWELLYGIRRLPEGRRRSELERDAQRLVASMRSLLPFDVPAAEEAARLRALREAAGRPVHSSDVLIAGICASRHASLATRNVGDFEGLGLEVIDPWG